MFAPRFLAFTVVFTALATSYALASPPEVPARFASQAAVRTWADARYSGGADLVQFRRGEKEVLVVIGSATSGRPTSEILVVQRAGQAYELVLRRAAFVGVARVTEEGDALVFRARTKLLELPWSRVIGSENEQYDPR